MKLTRRQFGKVAGSFVLAFSLAPRLAGAQTPKLPGSLANDPMLDAWLRINADGSQIFVTLIDHNPEKPLGAGEASQGPMAAAIANAFANATGRRLRDLPFSPERVETALG